MKLKSALVGFLSNMTWTLDPGIMEPLMQISVWRVPVPYFKHFWTGDDSFGTGTILGRMCALGKPGIFIQMAINCVFVVYQMMEYPTSLRMVDFERGKRTSRL